MIAYARHSLTKFKPIIPPDLREEPRKQTNSHVGFSIEKKMKRYHDIQELLSDIQENIAKIESSYASATKNVDIKAVSRPCIKTCLEHLRSCLEYCAQDIHDRKIGGKKRPYFPYGDSLKKFQDSVASNLPNINKLAPEIYQLILSIQPFVCSDDWLAELCKHTNFNKHNRLTEPNRVNSPSNTTRIGRLATISSGATLTMHDCYIDDVPVGHGKPLELDTQRPVEEMQAELPWFVHVEREFDWVEFRFPGTVTDALCLIKKAHANVTNFVSLLESELP